MLENEIVLFVMIHRLVVHAIQFVLGDWTEKPSILWPMTFRDCHIEWLMNFLWLCDVIFHHNFFPFIFFIRWFQYFITTLSFFFGSFSEFINGFIEIVIHLKLCTFYSKQTNFNVKKKKLAIECVNGKINKKSGTKMKQWTQTEKIEWKSQKCWTHAITNGSDGKHCAF